MAVVLVRYFASARAASGVAEEELAAETVGEALDRIGDRHGAPMEKILQVSSVLVNGVHVADPAFALADAAEVDILPPFAGG